MNAVYGSPDIHEGYYQDERIYDGGDLQLRGTYSPVSHGEVSPMRTFMENTVKHRQDRLREEEQLQFSETKARQLQRVAMTHTALKTFQE